jgi:hypothetical protein
LRFSKRSREKISDRMEESSLGSANAKVSSPKQR